MDDERDFEGSEKEKEAVEKGAERSDNGLIQAGGEESEKSYTESQEKL
jgi:hypothetical protein